VKKTTTTTILSSRKKEATPRHGDAGTHPVSRWKGRSPSKPGKLVTTRPAEELEAAKATTRKQRRKRQREQRPCPSERRHPGCRRRRGRGRGHATVVIWWNNDGWTEREICRRS
jgi:hypothetical protein